MTEEQIKAKAKEQFPNDEFKQQAIINAINWATKELQEEANEWKTKFENLERKCRFNFTDLLEDVGKEAKQNKQLTEAKEIISKIIELEPDSVYFCEDYKDEMKAKWYEAIAKAEAFINKEIKEND